MPEEITAEYESGQLVEVPPLSKIPWVTVACKTDLGRVRENNEDKYEYFIPEDTNTIASRGSVFMVCDGMGGHAAGQIASELACKTFIDVYLNHPATEVEQALRAGVIAAHRYVSDAQVGDSRIYLLRDGVVTQLTHDHTWVDEMIRMGKLTPEEAENHPYKHVLTRAIGGEGPVEPDILVEKVEEGDVFLLCSDGLTNHVTDEQIRFFLGEHGPSEACWKLVGAALQGGGSDNCTVMIVRVDEIVDAE